MRIIDITHPPQSLWIGREGENTFRPVSFECANWFSAYPNATIAAYYQPYGSTDPYPLVLVADGTKRIWHPLLNELVKGDGELQIVLMQGETVGTSAIIPTKVDRSLISNADHPESEIPAWPVKVVQDVTEQADRAEDAVEHYPQIRDGYWWVWDVASGKWVNTGVKATGEGGTSSDAVLYTPQSLTDSQKAQARSNIDAAKLFVVRIASESDPLTANKTFAETYAAIQNDMLVRADLWDMDGDLWLDCIDAEPTQIVFGGGAFGAQMTLVFGSDESLTRTNSQIPTDAVLYTEQTLTNAQRERARSNISAISKSDLSYVTPEQFGAVGDGVTDDTTSIQAAVDSGKNVRFSYGKTYKCGTINVTKNIEIDCCWAKFICTEDVLFDCAGEVTGTVEGADYVGGKVYELPNEDKYIGVAMLTSNDNVITTGNYYYGGFITEFFDGVCAEKYPVSFAGVTIEKINPVICKILNIGEVTFLEQSGYTYAVKITYGAMCEVNGFNITGDYYSAVTFAKCLNCTAQNITGVSDYSGSQNYPIEFLDSSKCVLNSSDIKSAKWTCFAIGGNYLCYNNRIRHSTCITTAAAHGIGSHDNAIGTVIEDCKATGFHLGANGRILNCKNLCNGSGENAKTNIALMCSTIEDISNFVVDGIEFVFQEEGNPSITSGITLEASGTSGGLEAYARNVEIKNLRTNRADLYTLIRFCNFNTTEASTHLYVNGSIVCDAVVGCYGFTAQMASRVSFGNNSHFVLRNSIAKRPDGKPALLLGANGSITKYPAKVEVENCYIYSLAGTFGKLRLFNVSTSGNYLTGFSGDYLECSNSCTIHSSTIAAFTSTRFLDSPTNISAFNNDSGYQTAQDVQTAIAAIPDELPSVTASDNGKFLRVVNGAWAAETVSTWQGGSY